MFTLNKILMFCLFVQVLGKSAKPIPVMILGIVFARKRYPHAKFLFILMIVIGVAMFLYKDSAASAKGGETSMFGVGELLLVGTVIVSIYES